MMPNYNINIDQHPSVKQITLVLKEVHNGNKNGLITLLETYPKFHWSQIVYDKTGDSVLHCASRLGHIDIIEYLLSNTDSKYVNCKNKDDKTSLHEAAQFSQYDTCKILLQYGADVNALKRADWTPLMLACTKKNGERSLKTIELLLDNGAIVNYRNKDGWTAIHLISREGDIAAFNLLVKNSADFMLRTKNGRTALHIAALHGNKAIVKALLNLGLGSNEQDSCGNTPLHEAVLGRNIDICKIFIQNGASTQIKNGSDYNLLHLAASEGYLDMMGFVCNELKFDINGVNKNGLTALHCAARNRRMDAYQYLIKIGSDINIKDNLNRLPFDYI